MKWIAIALIVIGAFLFVDHRNGFVPLALGIMIFGYWYFVEREPSDRAVDESEEPAEDDEDVALAESSTSFDLPDFGSFLRQLRTHLSGGFGQRTVDHIADLATRMKHNEERSVTYAVTLRGQRYRLTIGLFRGDAQEIAACFHAPKPLADLIDSEMESFFATRGM